MIKISKHPDTDKNFSMAIVWINGGSDMDKNGKKGINQILCSLLTRGCEGFDNFEFSEHIHCHGAELNHEIYEDGILISIKSLNEYFNKLFPLINLIIDKPLLQENQFQFVKNTIKNVIKKEKENPFNIVYEKWRKIVYKEHPYAFNCSGYLEDISRINYEEILIEYSNFKKRDKFLITNNNQINIENSIDNKNKLFSDELNFYSLNLIKEYRFVSTHTKSNQIILMLGNQTCSQFSDEYPTLKVLESHLSYGMSSVLFKLFREKNGLTYDVGVFNPSRKQNSPFLIYLSVSNNNALLAFRLLSRLWQKNLSSQINPEELYLAKEKLKGAFFIASQSLEEILQRKIQYISSNFNQDHDKFYLQKIEEVTSKNILEITNKYLSMPFLSIYGDKKICNEIKSSWIKDF